MHSLLTLWVAVSFATGAHALSDERLDGVIDGFETRRDEILRLQVQDPYPASGAWHYTDFALAALYRNDRVAQANEAILKLYAEFPVDPDPEREPGQPEVPDAHWHINLLQRIWFLFNHDSAFFPGRLSEQAEAALLEMFWRSARRHCRLEYASLERTWWIWGSENHGAMSRSGFWGSAHILSASAQYRDKRYEDGSTPAEMARAWDEYYKQFARQRAAKGLLVEIASTYNKYTLQGWYNMMDFGTDPVLRKRMQMLLDLFWADWAIEQLEGVRGGGKHRIYPGATSTSGVRFSGSGMAWLYFELGLPRTKHPGHMCAVTSSYRPPACVVDMALDTQGRGVYEYVSRRPGLNLLPKPQQADWQTYALRPDFGGITRYSYCTPSFIMGTSMVQARPHEHWSAISSQNRWDGVIFAAAKDACIFPQPLKPQRGSVYNAHWSVQCKGAMILQKLRTHRHAHGQRIWFADALELSEQDSWVFAKAPQAYAACRIVIGQTHWEASTPQDGAKGKWLVCEDEFSPIIFEVVEVSEFASIEGFKQAIRSAEVDLTDGTLTYQSAVYDNTLTFHTQSTDAPMIDGKPVDYAPPRVYDSPFIQSEWDSGIVTLQKDGRRKVLDFNAS